VKIYTDRGNDRTDASDALEEIRVLLESAAEGDILYRGAAAWALLSAGTDGQVLTLASGVPAWADPDSLLQSTFVTSDDETIALANSRQLLGGTGITLDAGTPGELTIDNDNP
jgi:hypothetical protein